MTAHSTLAFTLYPYARSADQDRATPAHHKVIVVGGGPVGLAMALDLGLRGVPVLATDLAVTRETLGDYALYLDPDDRAAWANAIRNLATAPGKRPPLRLADWTAHFNLVFNHL